jgi:hypothetical protein
LKEAAAELRMSERTLREHVKYGEIAFIKKGRGSLRDRRMFDPKDIEGFKERQRRIASCPSTSTKVPATTTSISDTKVIGFTAQPSLKVNVKRKDSSVTRSSRRAARKWIKSKHPGGAQ